MILLFAIGKFLKRPVQYFCTVHTRARAVPRVCAFQCQIWSQQCGFLINLVSIMIPSCMELDSSGKMFRFIALLYWYCSSISDLDLDIWTFGHLDTWTFGRQEIISIVPVRWRIVKSSQVVGLRNRVAIIRALSFFSP